MNYKVIMLCERIQTNKIVYVISFVEYSTKCKLPVVAKICQCLP